MITAVDTNVLLDIFLPDPHFVRPSVLALQQCRDEGRLVMSEIVWAEASAFFPSQDVFRARVNSMDIHFLPMNVDASGVAGNTWRKYRKNNRQRKHIFADFLIAAHAATQCDRLLTRDRGFSRRYFKDLVVYDPSQ